MNIGLIAMSGIRCCDPKLLELGLTLPGFVERSKSVASLPSLGLLTLAGMTPRKHELEYIEVDQIDESPIGGSQGLRADFDLVAISSFSAQIAEAYTLSERYRRLGVPVVIGGLHTTSLPHEALCHGASAVVGEGESVWLEVLRDAEKGELKPVYDARGLQFDLRNSPMPAFELLDFDRYNRITVQTSRGCPWKCAFCASSILLTNQYKQKPVDRVLAEIDRVRERWHRPFIEFADDNSFVNRGYWRRLLAELVPRKVRWFTETDLSIWEHDDLLHAIRQAGCEELLIGFESPIQAGLDGVELRRNWKKKKWPVYKRAVQRIQEHGIRVNACFVLGLDGHTTEVFDAVYDFAEDAAPFDVQITYQTPFPETPLYHQLKQEKRLTHDGEWNRCTLFDINYLPSHMSVEELRAGFHDLTRRLYSEDFTKDRRKRFRRLLRKSELRRHPVALAVATEATV